MHDFRRNDYDVTNSVQVSSTASVAAAVRKLFNAIQGFPGPWIMIPGNHDAALTESVWTRAARLGALPANLHLALQGKVLDFSALGFSALTAPLTQRPHICVTSILPKPRSR